jgi:hypothetical protein
VANSSDIPLSSVELTFLRELVRRKARFMIVGVSAAVLQGADTVTQDVDLWFESFADQRVADAARAAGGVVAWRASPPMLSGDGFDSLDVVQKCDGLGQFEDEYVNAVEIALEDFKVKVLPLARVIASKQAANRKKDQAALPSLLAAQAAAASTKRG